MRLSFQCHFLIVLLIFCAASAFCEEKNEDKQSWSDKAKAAVNKTAKAAGELAGKAAQAAKDPDNQAKAKEMLDKTAKAAGELAGKAVEAAKDPDNQAKAKEIIVKTAKTIGEAAELAYEAAKSVGADKDASSD